MELVFGKHNWFLFEWKSTPQCTAYSLYATSYLFVGFFWLCGFFDYLFVCSFFNENEGFPFCLFGFCFGVFFEVFSGGIMLVLLFGPQKP